MVGGKLICHVEVKYLCLIETEGPAGPTPEELTKSHSRT